MPTALVTGASSGIGAAFARALHAKGYRLLLTGRDPDRLEAIARPLQAEALTADLRHPEEAERVAQRLRETPDLEVLVNNAGFGTSAPFAQADPEKQIEMVRVHVEAPTRLTRAALPIMLERRKGLIVHVASIAAFLQGPGLTGYTSTKRFLVSHAEGLASELRGTGVRVQALCPGFTRTGFHSTEEYRHFDRARVPAWMWMSADEVVRRSLASQRTVLIPGWWNQAIVALMANPLTRAAIRRVRRRR